MASRKVFAERNLSRARPIDENLAASGTKAYERLLIRTLAKAQANLAGLCGLQLSFELVNLALPPALANLLVGVRDIEVHQAKLLMPKVLKFPNRALHEAQLIAVAPQR